mmetsp:Transcript_32354/g.23370  ORF Transcript_32354/g.23370 Transcript_32354/m.23370 type:complete len:123 (+) Transcript_32354:1837-2205(+)|eukprot:CAMPEP_0116874316 /NCGR_PEP_ID=MMETSP0463-20121206/5748_1 /TAXON_ID=181622 /ORGANISM="Strombidinopsis sp, Strain SopsisLIS2011" /LENGTH=122 /DNA_ID=CAMNT_0004517779 /DNA_START=1837 /DNA_END=2205 /DNA_ORIENTATION=+
MMKNYTVVVMAFEEIDLKGVNLSGPRISMCAPSIQLIDSDINASWKGCQSNQGLGAGEQGDYCAGQGGAHGGFGGYGGTTTNDVAEKTECASEYPVPYYFGAEARYEGSGGASGLGSATYGG